VVLAKWLLTDAKLILLNDPTRGIDVGTKQEIYRLLRKLADVGKGVLFYTTDYAELIGCCDRVLLMYEGRIVRELAGDALTEQNILAARRGGPGRPLGSKNKNPLTIPLADLAAAYEKHGAAMLAKLHPRRTRSK